MFPAHLKLAADMFYPAELENCLYFTALQALRIFETDRHQNAGFIRDINAMLQSMTTA